MIPKIYLKIDLCRASALFTFLLTLFCLTAITPSIINAAPGDLDTTFGAGKVFTAMSSNTDYITAVAVQPDGKIVSAGALYNTNTANYDAAITRHNSDGSLDSSFAGDGTTYYAVNSSNTDVATAVAIDSNGKIVIAGRYISGAGNWNTFVIRLNGDGAPDNTFGVGGLIQHDVSGGARNNEASSIALQADGKIVVAGYSNNPASNENFAVVRYTSTGAVDFVTLYDVSLINDVDRATSVVVRGDGKIIAGGFAASSGSAYNFAILCLNDNGTLFSTYNSGGVVHTDINANSDFIYSLALQTDGKLVAAGRGDDGVKANFAVVRYNTNGTLDTSFDGDGKLTTNFNNRPSEIFGLKIQSDGKIVAAGYNRNGGTHSDFALARYDTNGTLDATFDADGKVVYKISSFDNFAYSVALQADGKIVAAGFGTNTTNQDFALVRLNTNGSLDGSFAPSGKVTTAFGNNEDTGAAVALQSDGKIVVAGSRHNGSNYLFAVARYNADGSLDPSFGNGGKVETSIGSGDARAEAVAIQTDGKIIAAGYYINGTSGDSAIVRYNANGTLDATFGSGGRVTTQTSNSTENFYALALQSDGKIVAAGRAVNGSSMDFVIVRYNTIGMLDGSFDGDGIRFLNFLSSTNNAAQAVAVQTDGKIIVAGSTYNGSSYEFATARLNSNGSHDASTTTNVGAANSADEAFAVAIQPDGKIIAAGLADGNFGIVRYNTNFSLDTSFDFDGKVTTSFGGSSIIYGIALQSDGKILAGGTANSSSDFALARYNTDGSLDSNFSGDGKLTTDINGGQDVARGIAIQTDGKMVLAGYSHNGSNNDFAVARYLAGADCTYSISPTSSSITAAAATGTINVTTNETYCTWTAASNDAWLTVTGGASGTGNGTVNYSVAANTGAARVGTISVGGQTFTVNQAAAVSVSVSANIQSLKNAAVTVPVNVSDTTGKGIISFDFRITYDSSVLISQATAFDAAGTLSSGFNINVNSAAAGVILVSGYGTAPLSGAGALLNLKFTAVGTAPACSAVTFTAFQFNDGSPAANTANGQVCIVNGSVSGAITNPNTTGSAAVPNVTLTAAGNTTFSTTTGAGGDYLLEGFGNGNYTVTPAKTGDVNGAILSYDAALIARYAVQLETLNSSQLTAADVSGSGTVNSYDAALIAQYLVGISNPGTTGSWKFTPASRVYTDLTANQPSQNYAAILMGDVSGNWTAPSGGFAENEIKPNDDAVGVSLPNLTVTRGFNVSIPVTVGEVSGRGFISYDAAISFDPDILRLDSVTPVDKAGTISSQMALTANANSTGKITLSSYSTQALDGNGTLFSLNFTVIGQTNQVSPLRFERFTFNEDGARSFTIDGQLRVVAPTAASVPVGGRVMMKNGFGIENVRVTMTGSRGETRTTVTNSFGFYLFDDVPAGETYIFDVSDRRYTFAQNAQKRIIVQETKDIVFVADN